MKKRMNLILLGGIAVAVTLYFCFFTSPGADLQFDDSVFTLNGPDGFSYSVAYENVASLSLESGIDYGAAVDGGSEKDCTYGTWESDALGEYARCTLDKVEAVIVLTDTGGGTLVFNYQSENSTASVYQGFADLLGELD